jgi:hypothetical protein
VSGLPLQRREVTAETLDALDADDPEARRSRRDLQRIHRAMASLAWLRHAVGRLPSRPVTLIELGAGDGTLMLRLARALAPAWRGVALTLLDRRHSVEAPTLAGIQALGWQTTVVCQDVFEWARTSQTRRYDLCVATLFLHHFADDDLGLLLRGIAARTDAFVALEPRRDAWGAMGSRLVGLLGGNAVTRGDAVKSVAAGFAGRELGACWPAGADWWTEEFHAWPFSHAFLAARRGTRGGCAP